MKFLCGSCRTKYQISDDKVRGKVLTIRCKKCGAKLAVKETLVGEAGALPIAPLVEQDEMQVVARGAAQGGASSTFDIALGGSNDEMPTTIANTVSENESIEWYVAIDGKQQGPFRQSELQKKIEAREFEARYHVWHDGFDGWKRIRDVPELARSVPEPPKKKPPPPPSQDVPGKVVDFASKRAERERKSGTTGADLFAGTDDLEETESPEEAEGERAASAEAVSMAAGISMDDTKSERGSESAPDDLFASVPRASHHEIVSKEATKFFVQAAGASRFKSRNRVAMIIGGCFALVFLGVLGAAATGSITIRIPGLGTVEDVFKGRPTAQVEEEPELDMAMTPKEAAALRRSLEGRSPKERAEILKKLGLKPSPKVPGGYVQDGPEGAARRLLKPDGTPESFAIDLPGATTIGKLPETDFAGLPESGAPAFDNEGAPLDEKQIDATVKLNQSAVASCYRQFLKSGEGSGKFVVEISVNPGGEVKTARVPSGKFKGTPLEKCVTDKIRGWRFPKSSTGVKNHAVSFVLVGS